MSRKLDLIYILFIVLFFTLTLSYKVDCKTEKQTIKLNVFLSESFITVKHKGEKIRLKKDSIYGIQNCEGPLIRFQDKEHFLSCRKGITLDFL